MSTLPASCTKSEFKKLSLFSNLLYDKTFSLLLSQENRHSFSKVLFLVAPDQCIIRILRIMRKDFYMLRKRQYSSEKVAIENLSEGQFPTKENMY